MVMASQRTVTCFKVEEVEEGGIWGRRGGRRLFSELEGV